MRMGTRPLIFVILIVVLPMLFAACGSDSGATSGTQAEDGPLVLRVGDTFTVDTFVEGGFKKSKEFSTETVPLAASVWYGFYSQRDVEIRFYSSHADALTAGVESALAAIGRSPNSNIGGGIITSAGNRTQYADYLVAGNAVVLCQQDIVPCEEMVAAIP